MFRLDRGVKGVEREVDDELRFHMEMTVAELVAGGMPADEATAEARRRFGDVRLARERLASIDRDRVQEARRSAWWDAAWQDFRYAARGLRLKPGFTAAVIVTLGLGIGANAAMFGVVDRLLFRPPALMKDASHVNRVYLARTFDGKERRQTNMQYRRYLELADWTRSFDRQSAMWFRKAPVGEGEAVEERVVGSVSASYFSFFDAPPFSGRYFSSAEDTIAGGAEVAVLAHRYWLSRFGGRREAVGERIKIGSRSYLIIGIAPPQLGSIEGQPPVAFIPITTMGETMGSNATMYHNSYSMTWMEMIVHRKPGATIDAASADLTNAFKRSYQAQREMNPKTTPAELVKPRAIAASIRRQNGPERDANAKVAVWLSGVALIVLLVACANVANLLLARSFGRKREIAVRLALGVSRMRLMSQLMIESLVLAVLGGVAGLFVAHVGGALLRTMLLGDVEWTSALVDARTLLFTALATLTVGALAGLAPAVQAAGHDLATALKSGAREGKFLKSRLRTSLLVLQGALSVVLLVGAGLFVRSLQHARAVPLGWDPERVMFVHTDLRSMKLSVPEQIALKTAVRDRAAALPGVEAASRAVSAPFWQSWDEEIFVAGIDSTSKLGTFQIQTGSPDYFKTMGTRIIRGRGIEPTDRMGTPPVMVVSNSMAKVLWPKEDAIGKCVRVRSDTLPCREVVGIAQDIHGESLGNDPGIQYYMPTEQFEPDAGGIFIRTAGPAAQQAERIRRDLQRLMPGDSFLSVRPMIELIDEEAKSWTMGAWLFVAFGGLALLLASIGLYSVIAYGVAQRLHEIGVRVALGAQSADIARLVVSQGLRVTVAGLALGAAVALWAGKFVQPLLFEQSPRDPLVFASVTSALLATAVAACLVPALRATKVDPVSALRAD